MRKRMNELLMKKLKEARMETEEARKETEEARKETEEARKETEEVQEKLKRTKKRLEEVERERDEERRGRKAALQRGRSGCGARRPTWRKPARRRLEKMSRRRFRPTKKNSNRIETRWLPLPQE